MEESTRRAHIVAALVIACGCASSKEDYSSGPAFCKSYEDNYLVTCQQNCEAESGAAEGDKSVIFSCQNKCAGELADDGQFRGSCPERADKVGR